MIREITKQLRASISMLVLWTLIGGLIYPVFITIVGKAIFPQQANGSMLVKDGKPVGSELIGQPFSDPNYFWSRPSGTSPMAYNAQSSSGSNQGPLNPDYLKAVSDRVKALRDADDTKKNTPVPVDLVTASASGLDPHISPAAADFQVSRIVKARGIEEAALRKLIAENTEERQFGILGEPRVNVLKLNLALDAAKPLPPPKPEEKKPDAPAPADSKSADAKPADSKPADEKKQ